VLAAALLAAWLIVDPRTPDLAAQTYRVDLFSRLGFTVWDEHWYAGHHMPGYSLLFPPLGSLLGIRLTACLCVLASAALFQRIAQAVYGAPVRTAAALFAAAAVGDVWIGRVTFALGVSLALAAVLAFIRSRQLLAGLLAALCAAASPVAGVLLALAALTYALAAPRGEAARPLAARPHAAPGTTRGAAAASRPSASRLTVLASLAVPSVAVAAALAALFPEGGSEPYPFVSFLATVLVASLFLLALPRGQPLLRWGARIYLLACVLFVALPTPMGANVERYGVLLAGPLLVLAWTQRGAGTVHATGLRAKLAARWPAAALAAALLAWAAWVAWGPVRETRAVAGTSATSARYYAPLEQFLASAGPARVEVPLTRSHWEAALLARSVSLARGWEKQLDERYDGVLLDSGLTASSYERWLRAQAVSYVALPDAPLDASSSREGSLIRAGLPYLRQVFASTHWRVFGVLNPTPILEGPGVLTRLGFDSFAFAAISPGSFRLRVHYSRYLKITRGHGCVSRAPGDWTSINTHTRGPITIAARFSLGRALGLDSGCE
jgi:hypothetical protein